MKVWIPATSVTLEGLSQLVWWKLKSLNIKMFRDVWGHSQFYYVTAIAVKRAIKGKEVS